jgi:hypothetical protein
MMVETEMTLNLGVYKHTYFDNVILGGISTFFPTYSMVFTVKSSSRKNLQYEGALEHWHAQASDEAESYLILR